MTTRIYNGRMISMRMDTSFGKLAAFMDKPPQIFREEAKKHFLEHRNSFANEFKREIKKIIKSGGSDISGMAWTYWERNTGERNFKSIRPSRSVRSFSKGWFYTGRTIKYAVHPTTFLYLRKKKRLPYANTYALDDMGVLMNSIYGKIFGNQMSFTLKIMSTKKDMILEHERGWSTSDGYVQRKTIEPAWVRMQRSKRMQKTANKVIKAMETKLDKYFRENISV